MRWRRSSRPSSSPRWPATSHDRWRRARAAGAVAERSATRGAVSGKVTVREALAQSGLEPIDAQALLAHVLGRNRAWLVAHGDDPLAPGGGAAFAALARRRREGEPVAYLTGTREFWGL